MKIAKKHKIPKKPIIAVVVLLILTGVGGYCFYQSQQPNNSIGSSKIRPQNTVDYNPDTGAKQQQKEDTKSEIIKKNEQTKEDTTSISNSSSNINITLSRANQGGSGLPLNIRTIITGITSGNCSVVLTRDGQPTISKTFPIVAEATYATCQQADIAAADFGVSGEWKLSITATSGGSSSQPIMGNVNITK